MNLDFRTLFFIIFLLPLLYSIGIFLISRLWINVKGINFISLSLFVESAGFFLIVLRDTASPFLSIVIANAFLILGAFFFYKGVVCIREIKIQLRWIQWIWLLLFIFHFLSFYYYSITHPDVSIRIILISSFLVVGYSLCAYVLLRKVNDEVRVFLYSIAFFFLLAVVALVIRIVLTYIEPSISHFLITNTTQIVIMLIHIVFLTGKSFGILLLLARMNSLEQEIHLEFEVSQQKEIILFQHKMASMGEMLATISHQLKQPLASIHGILANLGNDYDNKKLSGQRMNDYLDQAESLSLYMSHTIDDFSEYLAPNNDKQKHTIDHLIHRSIDLTKSMLIEDNIEVELEIEEIFDAQAYSTLLIQVLIILLQNAHDAFAHSRNENKIINIRHYSKNKKQYIEINDNAGGISSGSIERIFHPYFSGDASSKGRGLGLYIAKTLIEENFDGRLSASNNEQGAVFTIEIR